MTVRDIIYQLSLPEVGAGPAKRMGFRLKGSTTGQGLDFLLEERNKAQKHWIFKRGVPTDVQWQRSSSTLTFLEEVLEFIISLTAYPINKV